MCTSKMYEYNYKLELLSVYIIQVQVYSYDVDTHALRTYECTALSALQLLWLELYCRIALLCRKAGGETATGIQRLPPLYRFVHVSIQVEFCNHVVELALLCPLQCPFVMYDVLCTRTRYIVPCTMYELQC